MMCAQIVSREFYIRKNNSGNKLANRNARAEWVR